MSDNTASARSGAATTGLVLDARGLLHRPPAGHPERPERLLAIIERLRGLPALLERVEEVVVAPIDRAVLERAHRPHYLDRLFATLDAGGGGQLDADTYYSEGTKEAALHAAAAVVALTEGVIATTGGLQNGIAFVRPPGHHATADRAMGFCLLNHVAIAAHAARARGLRVAIFDFDVHHGNGTEAIFLEDPDVLYVSTHEWPQYPGTGPASERGRNGGVGATVNVPLPAGTDDSAYLAAYQQTVRPALTAFGADLLLVSAGFDGHARDPLGGFELSTALYGELARDLLVVCPRAVFVLEGGYDLSALADCAEVVLRSLVAAPSAL